MTARPLPAHRRRRAAAAASAFAALALTTVAAPPAVAAEGVDLPPVPTAVAPDKPCTAESPTVVTAVPWAQQALDLGHVGQLHQGAGVTVAVVGTGVSTTAPALSGRVTALGDGGSDCVGHGTFLAGLVAARPVPGQGFSGIAPQARILAARGTGPRGETDGGRLAAAITQAADAGAGVIAVGAFVTTDDPALRAAVSHALEKDAVVVATAAPENNATGPRDAPVRVYPAAQPGVIAVVGTGPGGARPQNAPRPERADLSAPGDVMVGIGPRGAGHWTASGSAEAAAVVAGAAALVRGYHPALTGPEVRARLLATAYPGEQPALDVYAAVSASRPAVSGSAPATGAGAGQSAAAPRTLEVPEGPTGHGAGRTAVLVAGAAGAVLLTALLLMAVVPRGRARRWRPGGSAGPSAP
ncbi:S8 family serine peptidase [Streptomyces sp. NPDC006430]|uniref:S8 family serine peptidase n=1 Tax=Streptomyces sp. NPDC006430 TaxID=3154299 RepID=UPI0033BBA46D